MTAEYHISVVEFRAHDLMEAEIRGAFAPTMLAGFVRRRIKSCGASWHVLAGYETCKTWGDVECIEDSFEDG